MEFRAPNQRSSAAKPILIGCGIASAVAVIAIIGLIAWLASGPESGVKMANEMDAYAIKYIQEHQLLNATERVVAYYDTTLQMTGKEAAILTNEHVMYHKDGRTTSIPLISVTDVKFRKEGITGDVIEVSSATGEHLKIEIAPMNQGESFYNALMGAWNAVKANSRPQY